MQVAAYSSQAAAIAGVQDVSSRVINFLIVTVTVVEAGASMNAPQLILLDIYCCYFVCAHDARSVSDS